MDEHPWSDYPCDIRQRRRNRKEWARVLGPLGNAWVLHHCDEAKCWEAMHVYPGTAKQNTRDMLDRHPTYHASQSKARKEWWDNHPEEKALRYKRMRGNGSEEMEAGEWLAVWGNMRYR